MGEMGSMQQVTTNTVTGPVESDPRTGERFQTVSEYVNGEEVDRYVTMLESAS